jgi:hypothetical protein
MVMTLPLEIVSRIINMKSEIIVSDRMKSGWRMIHDEMMWRSTHMHTCCAHYCDVSQCDCYTRYPGFLLRRVDADVWLPGEGETRISDAFNYDSDNDIAMDDAAVHPDSVVPVVNPPPTAYAPTDLTMWIGPIERLNLEMRAFDANEDDAQDYTGAWWIDLEGNEIGTNHSLTPIV